MTSPYYHFGESLPDIFLRLYIYIHSFSIYYVLHMCLTLDLKLLVIF